LPIRKLAHCSLLLFAGGLLSLRVIEPAEIAWLRMVLRKLLRR
jgi:hypothetical protein